MSRYRTIEVEGKVLKCEIADSFFSRLRGLIKREPEGDGLMIVPCKAIHTFGMDYPITVYWLNREGKVIHKQYMKPGQISPVIKKAYCVVEIKGEEAHEQ